MEMWAGYAFAKDFREERGHAYMLDDQVFTERQQVDQAARHLPPLPRLHVRRLQAGRRRRPHQGLREAEPDAVLRGEEAGRQPPGGVHRLPRPEHDAAPRDPARASSKGSGRSRRRRASTDYDVNRDAIAPGDAHLRLRPVPRGVLLQGRRRSGSPTPGTAGSRWTASWPTTRRTGTRTGPTPARARRCSRRSTPSSRCTTRASTPARASPAPTATCPTSGAGALKISDHHVRSPLLNLDQACQTCHKVSEEELRERVYTIQDRTFETRNIAIDALLDLIGGIERAREGGQHRPAVVEGPALPARGPVLRRLRGGGELDGLPRGPGGGADPGQLDQLLAAGSGGAAGGAGAGGAARRRARRRGTSRQGVPEDRGNAENCTRACRCVRYVTSGPNGAGTIELKYPIAPSGDDR